MDVLPGIFGELDILNMPDSTLTLLGRLMNVPMSKRFKDYCDSSESSQDVKDKILRVIGKEIDFYTFPDELKANGYTDLISNLVAHTLPDMPISYDKYIAAIEYVEKNRDRIKPFVEPRKKEDYEAFLIELDKYELINCSRNYRKSSARVKANKDAFYTQREVPSATPARVLIDKAPTLEICLKGLRYLKYCEEKHLYDVIRRNF